MRGLLDSINLLRKSFKNVDFNLTTSPSVEDDEITILYKENEWSIQVDSCTGGIKALVKIMYKKVEEELEPVFYFYNFKSLFKIIKFIKNY